MKELFDQRAYESPCENIPRKVACVSEFSHPVPLLLEANKLGSYLHESQIHKCLYVVSASQHWNGTKRDIAF